MSSPSDRRTFSIPFIAGRKSTRVVHLHEPEREPTHSGDVVRTLALRPGRSIETASGTAQWLEAVLKHLDPATERLSLRLPFAPTTEAQLIVSTRQASRADLDKRTAELGVSLDAALGAAFSTIRSTAPASETAPLPADEAIELRPDGQKVDETSFTSIGLKAVGPAPKAGEGEEAAREHVSGVWVPRDLARRPDLFALGRLMGLPALAAATVVLEIERFERDVALKRILAKTYQPLADAIGSQPAADLVAKDGFRHAFYAHLAWLNAGACQRVRAWVSAPEPLPPMLLEMLSQAIYGVPLAVGTPEGHADLTRAWPDCNLAWLERLPALVATKHQLAEREKLKSGMTSGLRLGERDDGAAVHLVAKARAQHVFLLGQTGTGKSTHIANLVAQDMEAGEAVVVFDAHGDLAKDVLRMVPPARKKDLVYVHPTDPIGKFTLNVFESLGDRPEVEHNRIANDLINLFKRVYPEPREAYGPMFMSYCRNAIFLSLSSRGAEATVLDIPRIFADDPFRRELVKACPREDVKRFWGGIAEDVGDYGENASIDNVAPYIVAKLTQLSGNEVLAPIIGATRSTLDFRKVVAEKQICIVNLALPEIGEEDAKILGGLLFSRLSAYLQVQAKLTPQGRIPLRVYLDEVQTYADEALATSMAQMRKFGLSYVLACQHFAQLDGSGWRPDVGRAILGNAASLILFRLGLADAQLLSAYVAPTMAATDLISLPNFHAAARLLNDDGQPIDPLVFKSDPPR